MAIEIIRNGFGRQVESFKTELPLPVLNTHLRSAGRTFPRCFYPGALRNKSRPGGEGPRHLKGENNSGTAGETYGLRFSSGTYDRPQAAPVFSLAAYAREPKSSDKPVAGFSADREKKVLFEGAQGALLDVDHGTFPYVSSSNPVAGGICTGVGIGPTMINRVLGVIKAYTTRVGEGPFPTELPLDEACCLRDGRGREYGVTTGRPRRCGWFDGVVARYAARINGLSSLAVTKLDVLDGQETLKICTAYRYRGEVLTEFPADLKILSACEPVYRELPGWQKDTTGCRRLRDLPREARAYLDFISEQTETPVAIVSVGWNRDETIIEEYIW